MLTWSSWTNKKDLSSDHFISDQEQTVKMYKTYGKVVKLIDWIHYQLYKVAMYVDVTSTQAHQSDGSWYCVINTASSHQSKLLSSQWDLYRWKKKNNFSDPVDPSKIIKDTENSHNYLLYRFESLLFLCMISRDTNINNLLYITSSHLPIFETFGYLSLFDIRISE